MRAGMKKRFGRRDLVFLAVIAAAVLVFWGTSRLMGRNVGGQVEITVDGDIYGVYALDQEQEIPIQIDGEVRNTLRIQDHEADMISADCPDQICVDMKAISAVGETIVCLPHKVVVEVISSDEEAEYDTIVK